MTSKNRQSRERVEREEAGMISTIREVRCARDELKPASERVRAAAVLAEESSEELKTTAKEQRVKASHMRLVPAQAARSAVKL